MEEVQEPTSPTPSVMRKLPSLNLAGKKSLLIVGVFVALAGIATGWVLNKQGVGRNILGLSKSSAPGAKLGANEAGLADEATFKDTAEGTLEEGGVNGEGTHHLVREGGPSQNVYLTSTVIDLSAFVGKKVQVWGQTIGARKAGWLMDVGKIKVTE